MAWGDEYTTVGNYGQGSGSSTGTVGNANSKMNWGGLVNGATSLYELYNAYKASKGPKVDFVQPPMSPEQQKMWQLAYGAVSQLPTAQMLGPMAQQMLQGYSGMGWKGQGGVAIPGYGIEASAPSYSSPNTTYQLGPAYWQTPADTQRRPTPAAQNGTGGGGPARAGGGSYNALNADIPNPNTGNGDPFPMEGSFSGGRVTTNPEQDPFFDPSTGNGTGAGLRQVMSRAGELIKAHGPEAIAALGGPGLAQALGVGIKVGQWIYDHFFGGNNGGTPAGGAGGGSGFIPGSMSGAGGMR